MSSNRSLTSKIKLFFEAFALALQMKFLNMLSTKNSKRCLENFVQSKKQHFHLNGLQPTCFKKDKRWRKDFDGDCKQEKTKDKNIWPQANQVGSIDENLLL